MDRAEIATLFERGDVAGLVEAARRRPSNVLSFLTRRLPSADPEEKWRAVRTLGALVGNPQLVPHDKAVELMRRFVWSLNDESGAVPLGVPEAMGELIAVRAELQEKFLPILCSLLTSEEMSQTGPIERGAVWALGRVGPAVASSAPEAVFAVEIIAKEHADPETRDIAQRALAAIRGS